MHGLRQSFDAKDFVIQAERDSVYVSDEEVDQELDGRIAYFEEMFGGLENLKVIMERR